MRSITLILTVLLLLGFYAESATHPTRASAAPYHARVATTAAQIPLSTGDWLGADNTDKVPPAAIKMLRPNVLFGRSYTNDALNVRARVTFIQCTDSRDMGGHYPPVCYRAQGWEVTKSDAPDGAPGQPLTLVAGGRSIPVREYRFRMSSFPADINIRIYSFFIIPTRGIATTLDPVRDAAADASLRLFGSAQVQVITDASLPDELARRAFADLVAPMLPLIEAVEHTQVEQTEGTP
ncbi:MAG TPA: exosortase-associated EpsI family protein [Phycisphaerales bacterium]|nr:exosortase-associated EpsI family protein [Phycisphaerales bacterium]